MKETKHGVPGGPPVNSISPPGKPTSQPSQSPQQQPPQLSPQQDSLLLKGKALNSPQKHIHTMLNVSHEIPILTFACSCHIFTETVQLPRKLVRGQDVWLGKGAEQTRQILKCMWCGQSFRSLAEMTAHMQQTQHYTNIISQEQLISWRSAEDSKSPSSNSHVSAVLTCKVCDQVGIFANFLLEKYKFHHYNKRSLLIFFHHRLSAH